MKLGSGIVRDPSMPRRMRKLLESRVVANRQDLGYPLARLGISDLVMFIASALSGAPALTAMCKYDVPPTTVCTSAEIVSLLSSR